MDDHKCGPYRIAGEGRDETIICSECFTPPPLSEQVDILNEHASLTEKVGMLEKENAIRKVWLEELSQVNLKWAKEIARYNALNEKKATWKDDHCPVCDGRAVAACRCPLNDRKCAIGHWWRRGKNNEAIFLTEGHGEAMSLSEIKEKYFPDRELDELRGAYGID